MPFHNAENLIWPPDYMTVYMFFARYNDPLTWSDASMQYDLSSQVWSLSSTKQSCLRTDKAEPIG